MKVAILGLKGHINTVLSGAAALGDVEIVAISDDNVKAVESLISGNPHLRATQPWQNWRHLFEHTMMDVCCVADETAIRSEQLLAIFERDVHVVSEKPLTTSLVDLERLRTAYSGSKSQLTMLLELRHQPKNVRVRELIQSGAIGEVCQVSTQKSYRWGDRPEWMRTRARLGGTIPYIGIHSLDTIRWITGLDFVRIAAFHGVPGMQRDPSQTAGGLANRQIADGLPTETHASILAQLSNGASVTSRLDYLRPAIAATHGDDRLRVIGTDGFIEVNEGDPAITLAGRNGIEMIPFGETENLFVEFIRNLRSGTSSRITADDSFYITDVVLRARQAADEASLLELPAYRPVRTPVAPG